MRSPKFRNDESAVSPIISAILLLTIMLITVGSIMGWAIPRITQMENDAQYEGVYSGFEIFDSRVDDVIYGSPGTTRSTGLAVGGGDIFLEHSNGYILVYWSLIPDNVTVSDVDSVDGGFKFVFDERPGDNLTANITGTGGRGSFPCNASTYDLFTSNSIVGKVEPGFKFGDLQHVRIHNHTEDLAEIYYFKVNVMEHQMPTSDGYYEIKWVNGAIITNRGSSIGAVSGTPYIYPKDDAIFMNIIDLKANGSNGFVSAGKGSYSVIIKNAGVESLATKSVYGIRMSYHTEYTKGWNIYYINHRGFISVKDSAYKTIALGYNPGSFTDLNLIRTSIEVTGVT